MVPPMPVFRRRLAVLVAAGLLAAPGSAFGQSAGDEQYEDPFAGEDQGQSQGGQEPTAPAVPEPAEPPPAAPAPATGASESAPPATAAQPQLPATGADARAVLLAGAILLAGGVALRARLRAR